MALIGSNIAGYVSTQIEQRQKALGQGFVKDRKLKDILPFTTSTPWMRLASAVKITQGGDATPGKDALKSIQDKGILDDVGGLEGNVLAKKCVLQGAPNNSKGDSPVNGVRTGLKTDAFTSAYGWGYGSEFKSADRGYVPPPGITNIDFEYKNDGALAFATVKIKAFSATQFSIIDLLYMRPGYTCLLEFGHSVYLGNDGNIKNIDSSSTDPLDYLFTQSGGSPTYSEMASKIAKEKKDKQGNYEGFFGRITKFNWKFNSDGSYDITVKLTGTGDVITSLKANMGKTTASPACFKSSFTLDKKPETEVPDEGEVPDTTSTVISEAGASQLNFELYSLFQDETILDHSGIFGNQDGVIGDIKFTKIPIKGSRKSFTAKKALAKFDVNDWGGTTYSPITLIKFSAFLTLLQKICNVTDGKKNTLINFTIVEELASNKASNSLMVSYPGNFSADPNICLIEYGSFDPKIFESGFEGKKPELPKSTLLNKLLKGSISLNSPDRNKLTNKFLAIPISDVFININFIANIIKDLSGDIDKEKNATADVPLLDLINRVLSGVNSELGNINNFRVVYNEFNAKIEIISETPILTPKDQGESLTVLNTFGISPLEGSFITDCSLDSELSDAMATQISIGAQANGNQPGSNSTTFSTYNKGLEDSLMVKKVSTITETPSDEAKDDILAKQWFESNGGDNFDQVYNDREFNPDTGYIGGLKSITSTFAPAILGRYTNQKKATTPFFLPYNLSLTMHGLGGIKIYDGFRINGRGLPASYNPETIKLIVKSLSHNVSLEGWKTTISTISFPISSVTETNAGGKGRSTPELKPYASRGGEGGANPKGAQPLSNVDPPPSLNPTSLKRFNAMKASYNGVFTASPQEEGMCAQWSYNMALQYVNALKQLPITPKVPKNIPSGGNANNNKYFYTNLIKLGYTETKSTVTKNQLKEKLKNTVWGYGDVVTYYCNDGSKGENYVKYGHAQIYVGEINSVGWSTSTMNNYGTDFVYNRMRGDNWGFHIFRAPSGEVPAYNPFSPWTFGT